jgi:hypothetical protein
VRVSQVGQAWDSIGAALTAADFDGDGFWDLAITGLRWTRSEDGGPVTLGAIVLPGGAGGSVCGEALHASIVSADAPYGSRVLAPVAGSRRPPTEMRSLTSQWAISVAAVASVSQVGHVGIFYGA